MAKKNLLAANLKRPSLKRTMKVSEESMNKVVQKVADNPPPAAKTSEPKDDPPPKTKPAPAPAPKIDGRKEKNKTAGSAGKQGRGAARRPAGKKASSPNSVHPAEGTKRLTLDIPHSLHKELKLLSIHQEISMKDYIIQVVERSLKK